MVIRNRMLFVIIVGVMVLAIALFLNRSASREAARILDARVEASLVNIGGIEGWRADGDTGLYVHGRNGQWYYAQYVTPCVEPNRSEDLELVVTPTDAFDRFSAVIIGDRKCVISSFSQSGEPSHPPQR
jgi:hypothetical protein